MTNQKTHLQDKFFYGCSLRGHKKAWQIKGLPGCFCFTCFVNPLSDWYNLHSVESTVLIGKMFRAGISSGLSHCPKPQDPFYPVPFGRITLFAWKVVKAFGVTNYVRNSDNFQEPTLISQRSYQPMLNRSPFIPVITGYNPRPYRSAS